MWSGNWCGLVGLGTMAWKWSRAPLLGMQRAICMAWSSTCSPHCWLDTGPSQAGWQAEDANGRHHQWPGLCVGGEVSTSQGPWAGGGRSSLGMEPGRQKGCLRPFHGVARLQLDWVLPAVASMKFLFYRGKVLSCLHITIWDFCSDSQHNWVFGLKITL